EGEEAYVAIARAAVRDPDFDASGSAETIAERSRKRGAAERRAAEKSTKELIASLGDDPPKRELSRLEREGRDLARRRERVGQLAETRAAVAAFAEWYRDVVAESVGATGALVHSDRRAALEEDVRDGLRPSGHPHDRTGRRRGLLAGRKGLLVRSRRAGPALERQGHLPDVPRA